MPILTKENLKKFNLDFVKDVAKYFMDFLETDFHKRRTPRRSITYKNSENLLIGINVNKYPSFYSKAWELVQHSFDKDVLNSVGKGVYRSNVPKNLLDLVKLQCSKISSKQVSEITARIGEEIESAATLYKDEYDKALTTILDKASALIKSELVLPLIKHLEKPIENLDLGDEGIIYILEEDLTAILSKLLENKVSELINLFIAGEEVAIVKELEKVFELKEIQSSTIAFFDSFQVGDLFSEMFEMERNRSILDKQEFYFYFCDISFNNVKYPIFYIPFNVERSSDTLNIDFDSQVYINKKALEYIVQEYNKEKGTRGNLQKVTERIIYLAQHKEDFPQLIDSILNELGNFFELDAYIDVTRPHIQYAKSILLRMSNNCYMSLFDKSDEALVNDYEEILQLLDAEDSVLAEAFNNLIEDFIHKNPKSYNLEIEDEWDGAETSEKLIYTSPIPLNSEQLQILSAVKKDGCKYITVEGPPGTGKSHTITAIVFDAVLNKKSVLVLSDKKEALDVVEDKITNTLRSVRSDDRFQNPILRLGKIGSNYSKILSATSIGDIKNHHRAVKKEYETLEENIELLKNTLKDDLDALIHSNKEIDITEIHEFFDLEKLYEHAKPIIDIEEALHVPEADTKFEEFRNIIGSLAEKLSQLADKSSEEFIQVMHLEPKSLGSPKEFCNNLALWASMLVDIDTLRNKFKEQAKLLAYFENLSEESYETYNTFLLEYEKHKNWLLGYTFKKGKIEQLDKAFARSFPRFNVQNAHSHISTLKNISNIWTFAIALKNGNGSFTKKFKDYLNVLNYLNNNEELLAAVKSLVDISDDIKYLYEHLTLYPKTLVRLKINLDSLQTFLSCELVTSNGLDFNKLIRYLHLHEKIGKDFNNIPLINYAATIKNLQDLVAVQMTYLLDGSVIKFYENNVATAKTLKEIIRNKQRFPKEEFMSLKEAFPCILAGIRDYAEYIPLEPDIFDLVIIDEASQVSIAQAFPALLRAKKVLILGDKKQFSNVKALQAKTDTNKEYLNHLEGAFRRNVSEEGTRLVRLEKFDIKTSILEFFEFIRNYHTQLRKYFRGYKEIISYSNKYFYQDSLQAMKIRGKQVDDVLKFSYIKHDGKNELIPNTNSLEVEYILSELKKLKDSDSNMSVGIITPHTNQQKLLIDKISQSLDRDYYFEKLHLKIMTFDTCQGEERDIIFYSMVATTTIDRLWGVFIKDLQSVDIEEDGKIKAQRLNVGFSRAKEQMHFVLSKSLEEYSGSIREALMHYTNVLLEAKKERATSETDDKSVMEPQVMNWFYQTDFWKKNKEHIEFVPQFKIGAYLRQLDSNYTHPAYKVDFLLVFQDEQHREHKVVIEYDGFKEHFDHIDEVNEFNYQRYYSEEDVYRQTVLESYGYRFLRINKFNIGENPIATLDERVKSLIKNGTTNHQIISHIHQTVEGLQNGEMKECPKCKEVRELKDFKDKTLLKGYGRICNYCKGRVSSSENIVKQKVQPVLLKDIHCPKCNSSMVLRSGRYGKFYGCSKFPYCKGTRPY